MANDTSENSCKSSELLKSLEREFDKNVEELSQGQPVLPVLKKPFKDFQSAISPSDLLKALGQGIKDK